MQAKLPENVKVRSGVVWQDNVGFLLACDPEREEAEPYTNIYKIDNGNLTESWAKFNAHSICRIAVPERALVFLSAEGFYGVHSAKSSAGHILDDSHPKHNEPRYGSFRSVAEIGEKAYAVGLRGMAYRLDDLSRWTRIDEDLSREFDVQAIHGFSASDIYAVGFRGEVWHFNFRQWTKLESPTNLNLTSIRCAGDDTVYIGGHEGILIRGRGTTWSVIEHEEMRDDVWGVEWFKGKLYVSTFSGVYHLDGDTLQSVDFGDDSPKTTYQLSAGTKDMWSIGEKDVMSFDGTHWTRIV